MRAIRASRISGRIPKMNRDIDIEASNCYQAYMRGWKNGACVNAKDEAFTKRATDDLMRVNYEAGYEAGYTARGAAACTATKRTGHTPNVLRMVSA